jgi:predicted nuclease with TOPRIM domain
MFIDTQRTDADYAQNMILLDQLYEFVIDETMLNENKEAQNGNVNLAKENLELTRKLNIAEAEIESLKSVNERLGSGILTLSEKLENASNEIARLDILMKRQRDNVATLNRLGKNSKKYSTD